MIFYIRYKRSKDVGLYEFEIIHTWESSYENDFMNFNSKIPCDKEYPQIKYFETKLTKEGFESRTIIDLDKPLIEQPDSLVALLFSKSE